MVFSDDDQLWLMETYPGLSHQKSASGNELVGDFSFDVAWDEAERKYHINPEVVDSSEMIRLQDRYKIKIVFPNDGGSPRLYEIGGRLLKEAEAFQIPVWDLHINSDGLTCPVGQYDMSDIHCVRDYLDKVTLQFFFDQSYHQRYGRWPRGQYLHAILGEIENVFDRGGIESEDSFNACLQKILTRKDSDDLVAHVYALITDRRRIQGHSPCLCGSRKELKDCHHSLYRGLWQLNDFVRRQRQEFERTRYSRGYNKQSLLGR